MATRRRTSATKTAKTASAPVKQSTSTLSERMSKAVDDNNSAQVKVTKYTKPRVIKTVTETPTPENVRPAQPNLKWEDYREDIKIRWDIHQYETQELWNDVVKGYNNLKPVVAQSVDYVKEFGGSYLKVINPNATASCGCGESFAV